MIYQVIQGNDRECNLTGQQMDEKKDITSVPANGPFNVSGDQSEERAESVGERDVRPGFSNVCFAESSEIRDDYKARPTVVSNHQE